MSDNDAKRLVVLATLQLQELYEIKQLLIVALGKDKYRAVPIGKVLEYVDSRVGEIFPARTSGGGQE